MRKWICVLLLFALLAGSAAAEQWLDDNRVLKENTDGGGYAWAEYTYSGGRVVEIRYLDAQKKPVALSGGQFGLRLENFDAAGHPQDLTYLGAEGEPILMNGGYATDRRTFNSRGQVVQHLYFDVDGSPIARWTGQYGEALEYDAQGRESALTYLDDRGQPMAIQDGVTRLEYEYREDGTFAWFCDAEGQPYTTARGQRGIRISWENGRKRETPVGEDRKALFFLDDYLLHRPSVAGAAALALILAAAFLPRKLNWLLLAAYTGFMLYITLLNRQGAGSAPVLLDLRQMVQQMLYNAERRGHMIQNVLLFAPFGFLLAREIPKKRMLIVPVVFSCCIELIQLAFGLGWCEVGDLLTNSLGGIAGALTGLLGSRKRRKK